MDVLVVGGFWIEFNFWIYSHEVNFHHTHVLDIYSTSRIDVIWRNLISEEFQQIEFNFWISTTCWKSLVKILYVDFHDYHVFEPQVALTPFDKTRLGKQSKEFSYQIISGIKYE